MPVLVRALSPVARPFKASFDPFLLPLYAGVNGGEMACLSILSSIPTIASIDGAGVLYIDREGREPSQQMNIPGETLKEIFIRVTTGKSTLTIEKGMGCITHIFNYQTETSDAPKIDRLNLADLPPVLQHFICTGNNTICGSIMGIPPLITTFRLEGETQVVYGKSKSTFNDNMNYFNFSPNTSTNLSQSQLDALIIDLSRLTWSGNDRQLILQGTNPPRTYDSDAAVYDLLTKNVQIDIKS